MVGFFVRQMLDTLEFALTGAEAVWAEVDAPILDARRSGRPRRGGAERRVREPGIQE